MKKVFAVSGLAVLVYIMTYWSLFTVNILRENQNSDYIRGVLGAFLGALFAFLFFIGGKFLGKIYKNSVEHINGLVRLEYDLSKFMAVNYDNIFLVDSLIESIDKNILNSLHFSLLETNEDILVKLKNIDIINDVHILYIDIYKQNNSLQIVSDFYNEFRKMLIKNEISMETFNFNIKGKFREDLLVMKKSLQALDKKLEIVSSKCIVLANRDQFTITWLVGLFTADRKYPKNFNILYNKQLKILQKGRDENYKKSLSEIEKISRDN